ncbi:MAG: nucleoside monophosphate kinase [Candidatus Pacearchaeota archaeon]
MIFILLGPQGCGKGTQAKILSEKLKLPHISMGDLLRGLTGELKEKVDQIINKGELVPAELTIKILKERISKEDCKKGFILDGFPRNLEQAKLLKNICEIEKIIKINIPDEESIKRISGRRVCPKCKFNFNIYTEPKPKKEGFCDFCNVPLIQREDDKEEFVKRRLEIYHKETNPILEFYKGKVSEIDGLGSIEEVSERILSVLEKS